MTAGAFLLALVAAAPNLEADQVLITCQVTAGGKEISGVSTSLSFSFVALAGDRVHLRLAAPIESFDSGHRAFDLALRRASEAGRHPLVEIEGVVSGGRLEGTLSLHGVTRPLDLPLAIDRLAGSLIVSASFAIDLRDYGVSVPGVDSRASIDFLARLVARPDAVLAGGFVQARN